MSCQPVFSLKSPAKLNLGLEVLGKRSDGFHELATIFLAVDLCDTLAFTAAHELVVECLSPDLNGRPNLVLDALRSAQKLANTSQGARITLQKRIPLAAGLGGASSDAATTLIGCQRQWDTKFTTRQLHEAAARLGSDVPFLLTGGCALGRGRGERLEPLPLPSECWFVLVSTRVSIQNKTQTLFRDLLPADFTEGVSILRQEQTLKSTGEINPTHLVNAFARPLYERIPSLKAVSAAMKAAGASNIALSGAGPTHYSVERDPERALSVANRLRDVLSTNAQIEVVKPFPSRSYQFYMTGTASSMSDTR